MLRLKKKKTQTSSSTERQNEGERARACLCWCVLLLRHIVLRADSLFLQPMQPSFLFLLFEQLGVVFFQLVFLLPHFFDSITFFLFLSFFPPPPLLSLSLLLFPFCCFDLLLLSSPVFPVFYCQFVCFRFTSYGTMSKTHTHTHVHVRVFAYVYVYLCLRQGGRE